MQLYLVNSAETRRYHTRDSSLRVAQPNPIDAVAYLPWRAHRHNFGYIQRLYAPMGHGKRRRAPLLQVFDRCEPDQVAVKWYQPGAVSPLERGPMLYSPRL